MVKQFLTKGDMEANFTLVTGPNGSGKSRMLRKYNAYSNAYHVNYVSFNGMIFNMYKDTIKEISEKLWGSSLDDMLPLSGSQRIILNIAIELAQILDMKKGVIIFDSLPVNFDFTRLTNLFNYFKFLADKGYYIIFATSNETEREMFLNIFKETSMVEIKMNAG